MQRKLAAEADRPTARDLAERLQSAIAAWKQSRSVLELGAVEELASTLTRHFVSRVHRSSLLHIDEFSALQGVRRRAKVRTRKDRRLGLASQASSIAALVAYAGIIRSPEAIAVVRDLHRSLLLRFHDPIYGGFFASVDLESGAPRGEKSWELVLDVGCDYLLEVTALEDLYGGSFGGHVLEEIADIAGDVTLQRPDGAIFEATIADRRPKWRDWQPKSADVARLAFSAPKAAWLLLSAHARFGRERHLDAALEVLARALDRAFDWDTGRWISIPRAGVEPVGFWSSDSERDRQRQAVQVLSFMDERALLERLKTGREALERSTNRLVEMGG